MNCSENIGAKRTFDYDEQNAPLSIILSSIIFFNGIKRQLCKERINTFPK